MRRFAVLLLVMSFALSSLPAMALESADIFPLEEPVTFTLYYAGPGVAEGIEEIPLYQKLREMTNVSLNLISLGLTVDDIRSKLNLLYASGEYAQADGIWAGSCISDNEIATISDAGILIPITEYATDPAVMPNYNHRVLEDNPNTRTYIEAADGEMYSLTGYDYNVEYYMEFPMQINGEWLKKLGLEAPETIEEFKEVLTAFRDGDPNGNGIADEIPLITTVINRSPFDGMLGCWGVATKDGLLAENYVYLKNGEVIFVPTSEIYREFITAMRDFYEEGLIWSETFTCNDETYMSKIADIQNNVGVILNRDHYDGFVPLLPPRVGEYKASWYVHPGVSGIKNQFYVLSSCEKPNVLLSYMDLFYDFDIGVEYLYGTKEAGRYLYDENGLWYSAALSAPEKEASIKEYGRALGDITDGLTRAQTYAFSDTDYLTRISPKATQALCGAYPLYAAADVLNKEIWPRPIYNAEDAERVTELRADLFAYVNEMRAKFVNGQEDITSDDTWNAFIAQTERLGSVELIEIMQRTYDEYINKG